MWCQSVLISGGKVKSLNFTEKQIGYLFHHPNLQPIWTLSKLVNLLRGISVSRSVYKTLWIVGLVVRILSCVFLTNIPFGIRQDKTLPVGIPTNMLTAGKVFCPGFMSIVYTELLSRYTYVSNAVSKEKCPQNYVGNFRGLPCSLTLGTPLIDGI